MDITRLLVDLRGGDRAALDRLFDLVYQDLHERARRQLGRRSPGTTLSTTVLVHETYLKLADAMHLELEDRRHFFAVAAKAMRQIAVDHARRASAQKRGGGVWDVSLDDAGLAASSEDRPAADIVALDRALDQLAELDERLARTVELRYFAGLSVEETAEVMGVSERTVKRDWAKARAFLYEALNEGDVSSGSE
jgi:RNA polymerase sigma factor (TIGR02999 family)